MHLDQITKDNYGAVHGLAHAYLFDLNLYCISSEPLGCHTTGFFLFLDDIMTIPDLGFLFFLFFSIFIGV